MSSIKPDRCPYCDSKSGVDAHNRGFCHACKKDFPGKHNDLFHLVTACEFGEDLSLHHKTHQNIQLPEADMNNTGHMPIRAVAWLSQYFDEHNMPDCFWSSKYQRLCFPYYRGDDRDGFMMVGCWMRKIDGISQELGPKWMYAGENNLDWVIHSKNIHSKVLVICEDVVSALRISQFYDVLCLGGTYLKDCHKSALQKYNHVLLFLDSDSAGFNAARKIQRTLDLTHPSRILKPGKDPKCYSEIELKKILGG